MLDDIDISPYSPSVRIDGDIPWVRERDGSWLQRPALAVIGDAGSGATIHAAVTHRHILLRVVVVDAHHHNVQRNDAIWDGDSIQVGIDARGDGAGLADEPATGPDDASVTFALTDAGPAAWAHHHGRDGAAGAVVLAAREPGLPDAAASGSAVIGASITRDDAAGTTTYDIAWPWGDLQTYAGVFPTLGLAVQVNDSGPDGSQRRHHFGDGAGGALRPGLFRALRPADPPAGVAVFAANVLCRWVADEDEPATAVVAMRPADPARAARMEIAVATPGGELRETLSVAGTGVTRRIVSVWSPGGQIEGLPISIHIAPEAMRPVASITFMPRSIGLALAGLRAAAIDWARAAVNHGDARPDESDPADDAMLDELEEGEFEPDEDEDEYAEDFEADDDEEEEDDDGEDDDAEEESPVGDASDPRDAPDPIGYVPTRQAIVIADIIAVASVATEAAMQMARTGYDPANLALALFRRRTWAHVVARKSPLVLATQAGGVARPYLLWPTPRVFSARGLIVWLHGAGDPSALRFIQAGTLGHAAVAAAGEDVAVIEPWARGNAGYLGAAGDDVRAAVADVLHRLGLGDIPVAIGGHSMGGYGAWNLAAAEPGRFRAVAPCSPGWRDGGPDSSLAAALAQTSVRLWHGEADRITPPQHSQAMHAALHKAGNRQVEVVYVPGQGHSLPAAAAAEAIGWMSSRL